MVKGIKSSYKGPKCGSHLTSSSQVPVSTAPRNPLISSSFCDQPLQGACTHTYTNTHINIKKKTIKVPILKRIEEIYPPPPYHPGPIVTQVTCI